jgi:Tol biopolymer transport system component
MRDLCILLKFCLLITAVLIFQGCRPPEGAQTVTIKLVEPKVVATEEGVKLETQQEQTLAYKEVIERSPNVKSVTRVTENEDENIVIGSPILSPTEDVLVYCEIPIRVVKDANSGAKLSSHSDIYKQPVGAPAKTRITYGERTDSDPAFSSDGKCIVFSSDRIGLNPTLWRVNLAGGGGITKITGTLAGDYAPCVSPDNSFIVYVSKPPGIDESQIWTVGYNGLLPTQLREGISPQVSPDGKKILFIRIDNDSKKKQVWLMSIDGSEETQLTSNTDFNVDHARWSPDGKKIVYTSDEGVDSRKKHNFDIWMMNSNGTNKTQLTTNGSHDDGTCWDRNGKFIYFRSNRGGVWNIWRFEPIIAEETN